jgi:two-component system response regulator VanR
MRVLIAEDETYLADAIARGLRESGIAVDLAADGRAALEKASIYEYDVVVLDRDLPEVHGDEVCRRLAESNARPRVLMLTASTTVDDVMEGLALGADDYLRKPFAFGELVARIAALARRNERAQPPVLLRGDLRVDPAKREGWRGERPLSLTPKELAVLQVLLEAEGTVVTPEQLLERAWDEHADPFSNAMRMVVMTLRRKLGEPQPIETVRGFGYRIP